jgi:hypothetical protein
MSNGERTGLGVAPQQTIDRARRILLFGDGYGSAHTRGPGQNEGHHARPASVVDPAMTGPILHHTVALFQFHRKRFLFAPTFLSTTD